MKPIKIDEYKGEFFKVLATTQNSQVAVMTLLPGQDSGAEDVHPGDQVVFVLKGEAEIVVNGENVIVHKDELLIIPPNAQHHIYNKSTHDLSIFSVYAPPAY